jgi:hypothetical protein
MSDRERGDMAAAFAVGVVNDLFLLIVDNRRDIYIHYDRRAMPHKGCNRKMRVL